MGSVSRQIGRRVGGAKAPPATIDELLFGKNDPPSPECLEERRKLIAEFREAMRWTRAPSARACLRLLQEKFGEWDGKEASRWMQLVTSVAALRTVETEMRDAVTDEEKVNAAIKRASLYGTGTIPSDPDAT
jgi:hypothetical protein